MQVVRNNRMRLLGLTALGFVFLLAAGVPAAAQDSAWSVGLGLSAGEASPVIVNVRDIDIEGVTLFGRWQHRGSGWGAMVEARGGDDDTDFLELEYGQLNLYGTYTWRREKLVRPFVKFGLSNTGVELASGIDDHDTAAILGGGLEVGRGHWAFHFSVDGTDVDLATIDPTKSTSVGHSTAGVTFRF